MEGYDIHISGGTIVDGSGGPRRPGDVWIKDGRIAQIGGRANGVADRVIDADGLIVAPGFVDLPYPLRRPDPLGPVVQHLRLARGHVGRARQLRVRFRAVPSGVPRALDADDDPDRGHPARVHAAGHELGLGDHPRVPGQPGRHPQGRQLPAVHADGAADDLRHGAGSGQDPPGHRPGAQGDAAPAPRGYGRRPVRLLASSGSASTACRPTSTAPRW